MKPLYVLFIDASTHVPIGDLHVKIRNVHTFHFPDLEESVATMDWAKAQGWGVKTDIIFPTTGQTARELVRASVTAMCEHYHQPVPDMAEPAADPDQGA
jgi:hypothetical protein